MRSDPRSRCRPLATRLEPVWLESVYQIFIGVQSALKPQECIDLLTRPGLLDMKVGSSQSVDEIFRRGQAGLRPAGLPLPHGGFVEPSPHFVTDPAQRLAIQHCVAQRQAP